MPKIYRKLSDREIREAKPKDKNYFLFVWKIEIE
jgi:hypothetical protein